MQCTSLSTKKLYQLDQRSTSLRDVDHLLETFVKTHPKSALAAAIVTFAQEAQGTVVRP